MAPAPASTVSACPAPPAAAGKPNPSLFPWPATCPADACSASTAMPATATARPAIRPSPSRPDPEQALPRRSDRFRLQLVFQPDLHQLAAAGLLQQTLRPDQPLAAVGLQAERPQRLVLPSRQHQHAALAETPLRLQQQAGVQRRVRMAGHGGGADRLRPLADELHPALRRRLSAGQADPAHQSKLPFETAPLQHHQRARLQQIRRTISIQPHARRAEVAEQQFAGFHPLRQAALPGQPPAGVETADHGHPLAIALIAPQVAALRGTAPLHLQPAQQLPLRGGELVGLRFGGAPQAPDHVGGIRPPVAASLLSRGDGGEAPRAVRLGRHQPALHLDAAFRRPLQAQCRPMRRGPVQQPRLAARVQPVARRDAQQQHLPVAGPKRRLAVEGDPALPAPPARFGEQAVTVLPEAGKQRRVSQSVAALQPPAAAQRQSQRLAQQAAVAETPGAARGAGLGQQLAGFVKLAP
ncbi:hypothetical protein CV_1321 [Chromobacterium violaceum ATCC 12472]|uniref:Uncharacterized protein n=1 Tax=Chromobacterium violaceum (strain ATCC 12472 / DSM 30191 / JCM 1249 / CCUG 213 / NBRC 12614 / NCIMB 9131 / NCTC 9757 / MK) TaxID=243365 RepID=Q7NYF3_CHRVO|nr:hypothetical protein CV_1321 [Chromobacterium violaceum ATCC 12472]